MKKTVDWIRQNSFTSLALSILIGFLYYLGYQTCRLALIHIIALLPPEIFYDDLAGQIVSRVVALNIVESIIAAIPVAVLASISLVYVFSDKARQFGIIAITVFLVLFVIAVYNSHSFFLPTDSTWQVVLRSIKPLFALATFYIVLICAIRLRGVICSRMKRRGTNVSALTPDKQNDEK